MRVGVASRRQMDGEATGSESGDGVGAYGTRLQRVRVHPRAPNCSGNTSDVTCAYKIVDWKRVLSWLVYRVELRG